MVCTYSNIEDTVNECFVTEIRNELKTSVVEARLLKGFITNVVRLTLTVCLSFKSLKNGNNGPYVDTVCIIFVLVIMKCIIKVLTVNSSSFKVFSLKRKTRFKSLFFLLLLCKTQ